MSTPKTVVLGLLSYVSFSQHAEMERSSNWWPTAMEYINAGPEPSTIPLLGYYHFCKITCCRVDEYVVFVIKSISLSLPREPHRHLFQHDVLYSWRCVIHIFVIIFPVSWLAASWLHFAHNFAPADTHFRVGYYPYRIGSCHSPAWIISHNLRLANSAGVHKKQQMTVGLSRRRASDYVQTTVPSIVFSASKDVDVGRRLGKGFCHNLLGTLWDIRGIQHLQSFIRRHEWHRCHHGHMCRNPDSVCAIRIKTSFYY